MSFVLYADIRSLHLRCVETELSFFSLFTFCNWCMLVNIFIIIFISIIYRLCDLLGSAVSEAVDDWCSAGWGAGVERATERNGALSLVAV